MLDAATPSASVAAGEPRDPATVASPGNTLHLSVADRHGGAVALTITLNSWFGSALVAEGTGVLLNDQIDDFARYLMVLSRNAIPWSFLGFPAVSIPCGTDANGLPIGIQFVGPPHHDGPVVAIAAALERALRAS